VSQQREMIFDPTAITASTTHLLYDGDGGWIGARSVWMTFPHPEVDGVEDGPGWQFNSGHDLLRWLRS
jgi:hypothetical protein